ncbi:MAG: hypothetical protein EZS28_039282, partial [Streblomastix strix]
MQVYSQDPQEFYPNIAPELAIGDGKTSEKIDVWSVGIVVFQLVAHELPFKVQTLEELQKQMLSQGIIKPQIAIDDHLWDLLNKMLAFNPINRISASDALNHPYFTGEQAEDEITNGANRLVKAAQSAQQSGDRTITVYDITPSFIVQLTDIKKIAGFDPDLEVPTHAMMVVLDMENSFEFVDIVEL